MPEQHRLMVETVIETGSAGVGVIALSPGHIDFLRRALSVEATVFDGAARRRQRRASAARQSGSDGQERQLDGRHRDILAAVRGSATVTLRCVWAATHHHRSGGLPRCSDRPWASHPGSGDPGAVVVGMTTDDALAASPDLEREDVLAAFGALGSGGHRAVSLGAAGVRFLVDAQLPQAGRLSDRVRSRCNAHLCLARR